MSGPRPSRLWLMLPAVLIALLSAAYAVAVRPSIFDSVTGNYFPQADAVALGREVAIAADCTACHSRPGGREFAGGGPIDSPIGRLFAGNITPDRKNGIGAYTFQDFEHAIRHGVAPDGRTLYPAMPYPSYARISDQDIRALYSYFMLGVAAADDIDRPHQIPWPLSLRWPLALWRKIFVPPQPPFDGRRYQDPVLARGAYLVQGAGHCGACHTKRRWSLQEAALDEFQSVDYLAGGTRIDGWVAVNLRGNQAEGLGRWSEEDIAATLEGGRNRNSAVIGAPMQQVVQHSTQYLSPADRRAIARYLKSLPPHPVEQARYQPDPGAAELLRSGREIGRGGALYQDNCAACHQNSGLGATGVFPSIAGNPSVLAPDPASMIRLILQGDGLPATKAHPSALTMPAYDWRLSDPDVAQLISFIRQSWGNHASAVTVAEVGAVRKQITAPPGQPTSGRPSPGQE